MHEKDTQLSEMNARIEALMAEKAEREQAAEQAKMQKLKDENNFEELHRIELEQFQNKLNESLEQNKSWEQKYSDLQGKVTEGKLNNVANKIASKVGISGDGGTIDTIVTLLKATGRLKVVGDDVVMFAPDGSAVEADIDAFSETIRKDPSYSRLVRGTNSVGGFGSGSQQRGEIHGSTATSLTGIKLTDKAARQAAIKERLAKRG